MKKKKNSKIEDVKIQVKVSRYDPVKDHEPYWQIYQVPVPTEWSISILYILQAMHQRNDATCDLSIHLFSCVL